MYVKDYARIDNVNIKKILNIFRLQIYTDIYEAVLLPNEISRNTFITSFVSSTK